MAVVRFDESLSALASFISEKLGSKALTSGRVVRDAYGRLSFVYKGKLSIKERKSLIGHLADHLGPYANEYDQLLLTSAEASTAALLADAGVVQEHVVLKNGEQASVMLIDRRIVGRDWLSKLAPLQTKPPKRLVFASLKGGVGRSTALAVLASDLARDGMNVLAIDLDLEAPGLGPTLLDEGRKPRFGALDFFVENGLGDIDDTFIDDMVAASPLSRGRGLIDVVPAMGRTADGHPSNVLSKIARAYLEDPRNDTVPASFLVQARELVDRLAVRRRYDAVLIDTRAGLHETTAAALLGLSANVLLFGIDQPQTFASYRYLFAELQRSASLIGESDWWLRLQMVHAKASPTDDARKAFRDRAYELFREFMYSSIPLADEKGQPILAEDGTRIMVDLYGADSEEAPHYAWAILSDSNYAEFDPLKDAKALTEEFYGRTFSSLIRGTREWLDLEIGSKDEL